MTLLLFTTAGCHLCDKALHLIWKLPPSLSIALECVEIADSDELIGRYGLRIPVISKARSASESVAELELNWPFTEAELVAFLSK